jgi:octaheme c-type cytochrome (tetrathionate reductase family)
MNMLHVGSREGCIAIAAALVIGLGLAGCSADDGKDGANGTAGTDGTDGAPGINCWDLNQNGIADLPDEDTNGDGTIDVQDCRVSGSYTPEALHKGYFTDNTYTGTGQCLVCHGKIGDDVMKSAHWKWKGTVSGIAGLEGTVHGKVDMINNFCQAVPSNEGRCSQCHIGYGWTDQSFDFDNPNNIDCLACHDQTGTYKKVAAPGGTPDPSVDLQAVARSVGENGGVPRRQACVWCHSKAGGDDNVKHGDISSRMGLTALDDPNDDSDDPFDRTEDVHMGVDNATHPGGMLCVDCHQADRDGSGNLLSHGIAGFMYHSADEGGDMKECADCHGDVATIHAGTSSEVVATLAAHKRLACQVCHIPAIARKVSTYTDWKWSMAGQDARPAECAAEPVGVGTGTDRGTYNKLKGCFTWATNVRPVLRFYNGKWTRVVMGVNDKNLDTSKPVDLGSPTATYLDADAKIYPFKMMTGNQPFDAVDDTVLVPHLWGTVTGPNPYWAKYDWNLALQDSSDYSATLASYGGFQAYNGSYKFADTVMLLKVDHEVAPAEQALGYGNNCGDCHGGDQIDWQALGWSGDPFAGGATRP